METTRRNFEISLAKGEYGEKIVRKMLEAKGYIVYKPETAGAHAFDAVAIKDKRFCIALDVKAKSRRNKYADTGISLIHFNTYKDFSERHKMPFWLVFVDEMLGQIYGNTLDELSKPVQAGYPLIYGSDRSGTIYWHMKSMKHMHDLTENEKEELKQLSQRSYIYSA